MRRAVGYCTNPVCDDTWKENFLLGHEESYQCVRCGLPGKIEREHGHVENSLRIFREVRFHYYYEPNIDKYMTIVAVSDDSLEEGNVYHMFSPFVKTEGRALKMAESVLANLNLGSAKEGALPSTTETVLSWDDSPDEFALKCARWRRSLEGSHLCLN